MFFVPIFPSIWLQVQYSNFSSFFPPLATKINLSISQR